ncbi:MULTISPECIES: helix-turn-helix transcriptional regulator [unclassified Clostridium]|uniref:helix-turn-helix transcriptional regulator n=1 Tax=unclassified Clostridium TaxID=2614128 RepID=UPI0032176894
MNKIDSIRKKKCLSYADIAKEAGITSAYVCSLAKGKRTNPSLDVMKAISHALDEKVEKVFQIN